MNKHCTDCQYLHNAKHPKKSPLAKKYNAWCTKYSECSNSIYKHCILNDGKVKQGVL